MYGAKADIFFRSGRLIRQTEWSRIAVNILQGMDRYREYISHR